MFLRFKSRIIGKVDSSNPPSRSLYAVVVHNQRIEGKTRQRVVKYLAQISETDIPDPLHQRRFWNRATLAMDDVKQRLALEGADPAPTTPAEHAAVIDREEAKFSALIKELGLKPQ